MKFIKLLLILIICFVLVAGAFASYALMTEDGRKKIISYGLSKAAKAGSFKITIEGLNTASLGKLAAEKIVFTTATDSFDIKGFELNWNPLKLLTAKELDIGLIASKNINWQKISTPDTAPKAADIVEVKKEKSNGFIPVNIDAIKLSSIQFVQGGRKYNLSLNGNVKAVSTDPNDIDANIVLGDISSGKKLLEIKTVAGTKNEKQIALRYTDSTPLFIESMMDKQYFKNVDIYLLTKITEVKNDIRFDISNSWAKLDNMNIGLQGAILADKGGDKVSFDNFSIITDKSPQTITGQISKDNIDARILLKSFPVKMVNLFIKESADGSADADVTLKGKLKDPDGAGKIKFNGSYAGIPVNLNVDATKKGKEIGVTSMEVRSYDNSYLTASGVLRDNNFDFKIAAKNIKGKLLELAGLKFPGTDISTDMKVSGNINRPVVNGNVQIITDGKNVNSKLGVLYINSAIKTENNIITAHNEIKNGQNLIGNIDVKTGNAIYRDGKFQPGEIAVLGASRIEALTGIIDMGDKVKVTGLINVDVKIKDIKQKLVSGTAKISNGAFSLADTGTNLTALNINLNLDGKNIELKDSSAKDASGGTIGFSGNVALNDDIQQSSVNLNVQTQKLNVLNKKEAVAYSTGNVKITGKLSKLLSSGALEIYPLNLYLENVNFSNIALGGNTKAAAKQAAIANAEKQKAVMAGPSPLDLDIAVTVKDGKIESSTLNGGLHGKIDVKGNAAAPDMNGELNVDNGVVTMLNKKFLVEQGKILFAGKDILLDVIATFQMKSQKIIATIKGNKNFPNVNITSDPPSKYDDIFSLINGGSALGSGNSESLMNIGQQFLQKKTKTGTAATTGDSQPQSLEDVGGQLLNGLLNKKKKNAPVEPAVAPAAPQTVPASQVPASEPATATPATQDAPASMQQ